MTIPDPGLVNPVLGHEPRWNNGCTLRLKVQWKSTYPPSWTYLVLISSCHVLGLCHSFKGCALTPSLLFHSHSLETGSDSGSLSTVRIPHLRATPILPLKKWQPHQLETGPVHLQLLSLSGATLPWLQSMICHVWLMALHVPASHQCKTSWEALFFAILWLRINLAPPLGRGEWWSQRLGRALENAVSFLCNPLLRKTFWWWPQKLVALKF